MGHLDPWDVALLLAAVAIGWGALVTLMRRRRDMLVQDFHRQVESRQREMAQAERRAQAEKTKKKQAAG